MVNAGLNSAREEYYQFLDGISKKWHPYFKLPPHKMGDLRREVHSNIPHSKIEGILQYIISNFGREKIIKPGDLLSTDVAQAKWYDKGRFPAPHRFTTHGYDSYLLDRLNIVLNDDEDEFSEDCSAILKPADIGSGVIFQHNGLLWDELKRSDLLGNHSKDHFAEMVGDRTFLRRIYAMVEKGVFGNPSNDVMTYLRKKGFDAPEVSCGSDAHNFEAKQRKTGPGEPAIRITLDTRKLLKLRDVYHDPEGAWIHEEMGNTFMVPGGIPFEAISYFELNPRYFKR